MRGRVRLFVGVAVSLCVLLLSSLVEANSTDRFYGRVFEKQYFSMPVNERSLAMGGAWVGMRGSAYSVAENPAALVFLEGPKLNTFLTYDVLKGQDWPDHGARNKFTETGLYFGLPMYQWCGVFAVGGSTLHGDSTGIGDVSQSGGRLHLGFGTPIAHNLSLGYALSYFDDKLSFGPSPYREKHTQKYYLHRVGLHGDVGMGMRWGMIGDYGHGNTKNYYNEVNYGGDTGMDYYGTRVGFEMDLTPQTSLGVDLDWHHTKVGFGRMEIGVPSHKGKVEALRPMIGVEQRLSDVMAFRYGYRYNHVDIKSGAANKSHFGYHTVTGGLGMLFMNYRMELGWGVEYSWVAKGELVNKLALNYKF